MTMALSSLPRALTPAAFAVGFRVWAKDALRESFAHTPSRECERLRREWSSTEKADVMGS
jgi:hypothetical protein